MIISPLSLTRSIIRGLGFENLGEEKKGESEKKPEAFENPSVGDPNQEENSVFVLCSSFTAADEEFSSCNILTSSCRVIIDILR